MGFRILVISSFPLAHSAGLAEDMCKSLAEGGNSVDFLTRYPGEYEVAGINQISIFPYRPTSITNTQPQKRDIITKIKSALKKISILTAAKRGIIHAISPKRTIQAKKKPLKYIMYPNEMVTDVPVDLVMQKMEPKYDFIVVMFWEFMMTTLTLRAIWEKLHIPILISSPDFAPITGGCHYYEDCSNYLRGCGYCPGQRDCGPNDLSAQNFRYKKETYYTAKIAFLGNTWMNRIVHETKIFPPEHIFQNEIVINENDFSPGDTLTARKRLGIPAEKQHIFMFRSRNLPRKGNKEIVEAFRIAYSKLDEGTRAKILIILIGEDYAVDICQRACLDLIFLGNVNKETLIDTYRASSFFISASLDDAGPSMINQSILCGTPVICFDNGAALDVIENGISGLKCGVGDIDGLADCIIRAIKMPTEQYEHMRETTRAVGLAHNSYATSCRNIERIYQSLLDK